MQVVLLYDEGCGFCRWALGKILERDRASVIRPVALQDPQADTLLDGMDPARKMASWHLVTPDGHAYSGGDAVAPLARLLPAGAPVAWIARLAPRLTRRCYAVVARNRHRLGRVLGQRACRVSPAAGPGMAP